MAIRNAENGSFFTLQQIGDEHISGLSLARTPGEGIMIQDYAWLILRGIKPCGKMSISLSRISGNRLAGCPELHELFLDTSYGFADTDYRIRIYQDDIRNRYKVKLSAPKGILILRDELWLVK